MHQPSDRPLTLDDCDRCSQVAAIETDVKNLRGWVGSISAKVDRFTVGLIVILLGIVGNLLLFFFGTPNKADITAAVVEALKKK